MPPQMVRKLKKLLNSHREFYMANVKLKVNYYFLQVAQVCFALSERFLESKHNLLSLQIRPAFLFFYYLSCYAKK